MKASPKFSRNTKYQFLKNIIFIRNQNVFELLDFFSTAPEADKALMLERISKMTKDIRSFNKKLNRKMTNKNKASKAIGTRNSEVQNSLGEEDFYYANASFSNSV